MQRLELRNELRARFCVAVHRTSSARSRIGFADSLFVRQHIAHVRRLQMLNHHNDRVQIRKLVENDARLRPGRDEIEQNATTALTERSAVKLTGGSSFVSETGCFLLLGDACSQGMVSAATSRAGQAPSDRSAWEPRARRWQTPIFRLAWVQPATVHPTVNETSWAGQRFAQNSPTTRTSPSGRPFGGSLLHVSLRI